MKKIVNYSGQIEIEIPDQSIDMMLDDFKQCISKNATKESLFVHIAHNVIYCGCDEYSGIEGIGQDFCILEYEKPDLEIEKELQG
jgi:hypothetical protein